MCRAHGPGCLPPDDATPSQVGPAWLLAHHDHTLLIPGTPSLAHLQENVAAGDVAVTDPL